MLLASMIWDVSTATTKTASDADSNNMTIPFRPVPPVASWAATHKEAKMVRHPKTLIDFMEMYPTEEDCRQALFEQRWPQRRHENPCGQRCSKSAWRQSSSVGYISMKSISVFGCRTIFASLWVAAQEATGGTGRKGMVMPERSSSTLCDSECALLVGGRLRSDRDVRLESADISMVERRSHVPTRSHPSVDRFDRLETDRG